MTTTAPSPTLAQTEPRNTDQRGKLFRIYNHYRVAISLLLAGLLFLDPAEFGTAFRMPDYYQVSVFSYLSLNVFVALLLLAGFKPQARHISLSVLLDILFLHSFLLFTSGIASGLANLIIVSVAAGNILSPTRIGTLYAALAAIGSLGLASWTILTQDQNVDVIVRAGTLGILYFAAAFILQNITRRMARSEALASHRAQSILELEQINQQIIQRMRTGIVVVDSFGQIRLANAAAEELLFGLPNIEDQPISVKGRALPGPLRERLDDWQQQPLQRSEPFRASDTSPMLQANFTRLDHEGRDHILVFVEDISKVTQQAQQMKLASLGRLTAGIAHEIRNPLGAISHAAQLMAEADHLDAGDRKMLDIIQRHSRRVNGIIENVLELSRRRAANTDLVDVAAWLREFVEDYHQIRETQSDGAPDITLDLAPNLPPARFDRSQLEQVLVNLCDNGLRYSKQQTGKASLTIHAGITDDGERSYVDIRDAGPGIAPDARNSIFEPFFTTDKSGTGLGLYLARELCEANQAHLSLLDDDQPGSCFRITFAHHGRLI
ncbi:MAG: ATP-binding protein [Marinobacter sp.]|uniref:sensor histidine kinase n=1 Tax=Marinobacter sp. TaxID=50741 RepID=UPI00299D01EB|nr:ATP-binding protein [Marinobacter sp.]MDX1757277.1 ATP-binding protein [Marinobacter sp.]